MNTASDSSGGQSKILILQTSTYIELIFRGITKWQDSQRPKQGTSMLKFACHAMLGTQYAQPNAANAVQIN